MSIHTVKAGDTLEGLARRYLQTPMWWPIYFANQETLDAQFAGIHDRYKRGAMRHPWDYIRPGQKLIIPDVLDLY